MLWSMTFPDILNLWPTSSALADEIGEKPTTIRKWRERGRIPASAWPALLATSTAKKNRVTANVLVTASQATAA